MVGMPQMQLPMFPVGAERITREIVFEKRDGRVWYFNFMMPLFSHAEDDMAGFRMFTSQLIVNGAARQCDIARTFGVPTRTVKRYVKLYREEGVAGFYKSRKTRGAPVLTSEVLAELQARMDVGEQLHEAARRLGLKPNTVNKAFHAGKLRPGLGLKKKRGVADP